ncbi:MAG: adenylate/guanylate cyclase domain-containing protein [Ignavibacteria bacterium]|nr:adenylate/guanylate cyclase domain-containing protein [Ignavibacteria bacterium]
MFGAVWVLFAILYSLLEKGLLGELNYYPSTGNYYDFGSSIFLTTLSSFIMGCLLGTFEVFILSRMFDKKSFGIKIFYKTIIYLSSIVFILISFEFIINSYRLNVSIFNEEVIQIMLLLFFNFAFWSIMLYVAVIIGITLFVSEISDNIGQGVLINFFIGKYHTPLVEERIFMFLDMKSSTTIAEKLGHVKYYQLLNEYYADLTKAILDTSGEIYQYVGDEVVVSWKVKNGLKNANCLECFFQSKNIFEEKSDSYLKGYNVLPEFKAGFHMGSITTGEIGVIKKEIIFTGDVLNTTARIQGKCNDYNVDILLSEALKNKLTETNNYTFKEIGSCELRGKNEAVILFTVLNTK